MALTLWRSMVTLRGKVLVKRWAESLTEGVRKEREKLKTKGFDSSVIKSCVVKAGLLEGNVGSR